MGKRHRNNKNECLTMKENVKPMTHGGDMKSLQTSGNLMY